MKKFADPERVRHRPGPVRASLDHLVVTREIEPDPAQRALADRLDRLDRELSATQLASKSSALGWLFGKARAPEPVKGVYIHGEVGRGKTMIMDMFFRTASVVPKRRIHFHAFMAEAHERIGAHRDAVRDGTAKGDDPMPPVAEALAKSARLLCFDEFSVTDVADALILSRLFKAMFQEGVVLVATSNVAPDDLYRNGLNRGLFLPFLEDLKRHADIVRLDAAEDYRLASIGEENLYVTPLGPEADKRIDDVWAALLAGQKPAPASLSVKGRTLSVPVAGNGAGRFSFDDLLKRPLGAQDYLALAKRFHTIVVERVPVMAEAERNEAKRFIMLVDALYDSGRRIVVSAEAPAETLYRGTNGTEAFEFARTVSRLTEMRSADYAEGANATDV
ncbi:MAG: cell division protein ZapE [Rhizobiaceae bacterium]|nr:cell division protein ZapE [Rhizobiaceae bacterium]